MVVLNSIKFNELFGFTLFQVQTHKKTVKFLKEFLNLEVPINIFLGINYCNMAFLALNSKKIIF